MWPSLTPEPRKALKTEMILSLDSIGQFLEYTSVQGHSPNTVRAYKSDLTDLLTAKGETKLGLLEVTAASWLTEGRKRWAPKTTCRKATSVKAWAKWAGKPVLAGYRLPDPGKPQAHPIPEGMDGVARMLAEGEGSAQKKALLVLVCKVGMRISEALTVTPESFDLIERTVTVRGKGDKQLVKPVATACWPDLAAAIAGARLYGPGTPLIRWKDRFARQVFTGLGVAAGLSRRVSTHDGRATFATHVYNSTHDLRVVQELLGHSNSKTTEVYTQVDAARMMAAVEEAVS